VAGAAADLTTLLELIRHARPDVALVHIRRPPTYTDEGIAAARAIRERHPRVGVLVLSQYVDVGYALTLIRAHPTHCGYLLKDRVTEMSVLADATRRVAHGETVVDHSLVDLLLRRAAATRLLAELTAREREVLLCSPRASPIAASGERLWLTPETVETHVRHIWRSSVCPPTAITTAECSRCSPTCGRTSSGPPLTNAPLTGNSVLAAGGEIRVGTRVTQDRPGSPASRGRGSNVQVPRPIVGGDGGAHAGLRPSEENSHATPDDRGRRGRRGRPGPRHDSAAGHAARLKTRQSSLGTFLVEGKGRTLYLFQKDRTSRSRCSGDCAAEWPPLLTTGRPEVPGLVRKSLLGTSRRRDGKTQVTYAGHPLYRHVADQKAGDMNGQGVSAFGARWYAVTPSGRRLGGGY
jgi:predicted lipoprotein with Yx(FWY)xxD motif/DNA-binding NarL/FixJ family response regulator